MGAGHADDIVAEILHEALKIHRDEGLVLDDENVGGDLGGHFPARGVGKFAGFRDILVTQGGGTHPYVGSWWPPGHIIGYEHTFVHTVADFVNAVVDRKPVQPTFEDGLKNERVLEAVEESAKTRQWVKV